MPRRPAEHRHRIGLLLATGCAVAAACLLGACSTPWTAPASSEPTPTTTSQTMSTVPGISGLQETNSGAIATTPTTSTP